MELVPLFLKKTLTQHNMITFLQQTETWSLSRWQKYQINQLKSLLLHCRDHVPFYRKVFNKYDIKIDNFHSIEDLRFLPLLTRKQVRLNVSSIKATNYQAKSFDQKKTSGSSEKPLEFYVEKAIWLAYHLAFNRIFLERGGYHRGNKTVSLLGIEEKYRKHHLLRTLELSTKHLPYSYDFFIKKISRFNPSYIVSYPSAIYFLAKYIFKHETSIPIKINAIFCHGEPVYDWQKTMIEKVFSCSVFDIYGNGEKNVLSATCEKSNLHHVFPNYCIVELIDTDGSIVTKEGQAGEIVTTGLLSKIFPFIRYRTGDVGIYTQEKCSCKRNYPIIKKITGRIQDKVLTKTNQTIHASVLNKVIADHGTDVSAWQFIQKEKGKLILQLLLYSNNTQSYETIKQSLAKKFMDCFPNQFDLKITLNHSFYTRTSRKHSFLLQYLPIEQLMNKNEIK